MEGGEVEADEFKLRSEASEFGRVELLLVQAFSQTSFQVSIFLAMSTCPPYAPFFGFGGVAASVSTAIISKTPAY